MTRPSLPFRMLYRSIFALALWLTVAHAAPPPNLIVILTDDQGYGDLGCHGNPLLKTPRLDRLHAESVRLTDFHVTPLCAPTRAAFLTGRTSLRTGAWTVLNGRSLLRRDELTLADAFLANGYRTGLFGKWHLGESYPFRPEDRGFQKTVTHGSGSIGALTDFWGNDYTDDTYIKNGVPKKYPGYGTDAFFGEAIAFVEASQGRPFYCQLSVAAPHDPFNALERDAAPYRGKVPDDTASFFGMIANLDENVGRLLDRLDVLGLRENTIVIFMTDNGSTGGARFYNAGMRGGKLSAYDGGHRVPCFIRWPGGNIAGGRDLPALTSVTDLMPTLIDLCGLQLPRPVKFDGLNLAAALRGAGTVPADRIVITGTQPAGWPRPYATTAVMRGAWRYVNGRELFDLGSDPGQQKDLAAAHPEIVQPLRAAHDAWWREIEPTFGHTPRFVIGDPRGDPVWLSAWDLHGQSVYLQVQIEQAEPAHGYWEIEIASAGEYEFTLRRWPREVARPIVDGLAITRINKDGAPPRVTRGAHRARVTVGGLDLQQRFPAGAQEVKLVGRLPAGPARLEATFINDESLAGAVWSAYFVAARKL